MEKLIILNEVFNFIFDDSDEGDSEDDIEVIERPCKTKKGEEVIPRQTRKIFKQHLRGQNDDSDPDEGLNRGERNQAFAENVVPRLPAKNFRQHFRLDPDVFELICKDIYPFLHKKYGKGRNPLKLDKQLMITLSYLGSKEGLRTIADRFDVSISTAWRIVSNVCDAFLKMNGEKKIIKWPTQEEAEKTAKHYYATYNLKGVIGCIDSCHFTIRAPIHSHNSYINKKGTHSVILQAVSNEKMEFVFFYAGECGSLDDASLLLKSGLEAKINSGNFKISEDQHLLGDSSYPLKPWLITPYRDSNGFRDEQIFFNTIHSECLDDIKRSFGVLKGRFRRLHYIDCLRTAATTKFIAACCILHNICLRNEDFPDEDVAIDIEENEKECYKEHDNTASSSSLKRDMLMNILHA
ncbi:putative nuclease HARBI1 [Anastrepha obliqua]|uniref:putative nuclease HARBI1 n=1 Tax=Anastrepha obliqua TaxID=95512 RepID=UPI00240962C8|nr:putative nuclease HARBI1 [Anastrepha obliqua]